MASRTLRADDVRHAYNLILGRNPESEDVVGAQLQAFRTREALWSAMLASDEFRSAAAIRTDAADQLMIEVGKSFHTDASVIDHDVPAETLSLLLDRIRSQWIHLGETEPHWSVLVQEEFRAGKMDVAATEKFNRSGAAMTDLVGLFERRTATVVRRGVCLELGCGVGRVTRYLAEQFAHVIAVDISPGNLRVCEEYLRNEGVTNVQTELVSSPEDFRAFPEFDFFFSVIVLQHNSPPVQKFILDALLRRVRSGGAALFQIPTAVADYRFDVNAYLETAQPTMEMHGLPTAVVLDTIRRAGLEVRDIAPDPFIGTLGSNTFYAVKPN